MNWIKESNRQQHLVYAIPCAFLLTILFVAGLAAGMEYIDAGFEPYYVPLELYNEREPLRVQIRELETLLIT